MDQINICLNLVINLHLGQFNKNLVHVKLDLYQSGHELYAYLDINLPY